MKTILGKYLPLAAWLLFVAGCVNVDYVGQTFDPIPDGSPVEYFGGRREIPAGKYRIIGRGIVTTTRRIDHYDIREILVNEARKRGADAVVLVSQKKVKRGVYERESDVSSVDTAPASNSSNIKPGGEPLEVSLDRSEPLEGEHHYRIELELRVLFLKSKDELEQQLARRGSELDRLVKQPEPAQKVQEKAPEKVPATPETH